MRITCHFRAIAAAASLLAVALGAGPALAQSDQPAPGQFGPRVKPAQTTGGDAQAGRAPATEVVATHGAWKIQCETSAAGATDPAAPATRQCGMVQGAQSEKNPKAQLTLVIVKTKQADKLVTMMRVMAPIGVFLPTGVALEIDGAAVGRVPFTRCMPQVCMAFAEASPDTLGKLKKGTEANFIIYEAPGMGLPMKMSLNGFSAALADLENF